MPRTQKTGTGSNTNKKAKAANTGYEAELWRTAQSLLGSIDAAKYKHVVLGLIYCKCTSNPA